MGERERFLRCAAPEWEPPVVIDQQYRRTAKLLTLAFGVFGCAGGSGANQEAGPSTSNALCADDANALSPLRRLNRFEYGRSVEDLTGVDASIAENLPPDEKGSLGFDNDAEAYSVSTLHATKYLETAEAIADQFSMDRKRMEGFAECDPLTNTDCVQTFVEEFGKRAWRRPLGSDELRRMMDLYGEAATDSTREGLSAVVATMLQAPQFLYRPERLDPKRGLDPYAVATRLSYLFVGTLPDDRLLEAAKDGTLTTLAGISSEAERLLADPRAVEAFSRFVTQWWELGELDTVQKDRTLFRAWNSDTPHALLEETQRFLGDAWQTTPTLERLLTSKVTYVDPTLADFYGLPIPGEDGFVRMELDAARASGLLTQGSFLAAHAKANQTSPVHRGKFVRARLFCDPPPPPPPDIVVKPPDVDPRLPTRERFSQHAEDPSCSGCHELMDPIGFAFENYDAVGRYREFDADEAVDARGTLVGTDVDGDFDGVHELAERLIESDQVRACVATQWFRYAFGRGETSSDACALDALSQQLKRGDGNLLALLRATVRLEAFHGRTSVSSATEEP